jgi:hypothetical protein
MSDEKSWYPDPADFPEPEDFEPDDDFEDDHSKETTGGPGGIVNYPPETWPEGWEYVEGESTPPVENNK